MLEQYVSYIWITSKLSRNKKIFINKTSCDICWNLICGLLLHYIATFCTYYKEMCCQNLRGFELVNQMIQFSFCLKFEKISTWLRLETRPQSISLAEQFGSTSILIHVTLQFLSSVVMVTRFTSLFWLEPKLGAELWRHGLFCLLPF